MGGILEVSNHSGNMDITMLTIDAASHGFIVGHIVPEAAVGGPIALVNDDDIITIDAETHDLNVDVTVDEMEQRRQSWKPPRATVTRGTLAKYARLVSDASSGARTDLF